MSAPEILRTIDLPPEWVGSRKQERGEIIAAKGDVEIYSFFFTAPRLTDRAIVAVGFPDGHWARCVAFGGGVVGTDTQGDMTPDVREAIRFATPILHQWAEGRS